MDEHIPTIVIERSGRRRGNKRILAGILGLAFVAALGVGGTLAYLTYTTNQEANRFTTSPNITADLLEPAWTKAAADASAVKAPDNANMPADAANMLPGSVVAKDPFVVNTSVNGSKAWAGMKLQFEKWEATTNKYVAMTDDEATTLLKVYGFYTTGDAAAAGIAPGAGWTAISDASYNTAGAKYFYYGTALEAETADEHDAESAAAYLGIPEGKRTACLFDQVKFLESAAQADIDKLNTILGETTPSWRVTVTGAVIGATGATGETAASFVKEKDSLSWKTVLDAAPATAANTGVRV